MCMWASLVRRCPPENLRRKTKIKQKCDTGQSATEGDSSLMAEELWSVNQPTAVTAPVSGCSNSYSILVGHWLRTQEEGFWMRGILNCEVCLASTWKDKAKQLSSPKYYSLMGKYWKRGPCGGQQRHWKQTSNLSTLQGTVRRPPLWES